MNERVAGLTGSSEPRCSASARRSHRSSRRIPGVDGPPPATSQRSHELQDIAAIRARMAFGSTAKETALAGAGFRALRLFSGYRRSGLNSTRTAACIAPVRTFSSLLASQAGPKSCGVREHIPLPEWKSLMSRAARLACKTSLGRIWLEAGDPGPASRPGDPAPPLGQ